MIGSMSIVQTVEFPERAAVRRPGIPGRSSWSLASDRPQPHPVLRRRKSMPQPAGTASDVVLTIKAGEATLNRGKLAVTIHLLTYLTNQIHGSWAPESAGGAAWHFAIAPTHVQILKDDLKAVWAGEPATVTWLTVASREDIAS
jgi:hypothetical protein